MADLKKSILFLLTFSLLGVGFTGFIGSFFVNRYGLMLNKEMPLFDIEGIVVDHGENIYVATLAYGRIQVYNKSGQFKRSWHVEAGGGAFKMMLQNKDIVVVTARGDKKITYDLHGNVISQTKRPQTYSYYNKFPSSSFETENGDLYEVRGWIFSEITKNNQTIMRQHIYLGLLNPILSWLFSFVSILILIRLKKGNWKVWRQ